MTAVLNAPPSGKNVLQMLMSQLFFMVLNEKDYPTWQLDAKSSRNTTSSDACTYLFKAPENRGFQQVHALSDVIKLYTWAHYITQNTAAVLEFCHLHIIYAKFHRLSGPSILYSHEHSCLSKLSKQWKPQSS